MTNENIIPHGEGPVMCAECGKRIRSREYWRRWENGKIVFVCNKCALSRIDGRSAHGLMLVMNPANVEEDADGGCGSI